jgi:hypothetical protein
VPGLALLGIAATCSKAVRSKGGNDLPRLSARRKMPAQAFALKKYRCGSLPRSKMSDNEDAAAALGHSEELSVQNPVRDPIPELDQRPEHGAKCPSSVNRQDTGDVFPYEPAWSEAFSQSEKLQRKVAARVIQSAPLSRDGEGDAGGSSDEKINGSCCDAPEPVTTDGREIAKITNPWKTVRENGAREWIDLREPGWPPAQGFPGDCGGLYSRANGTVHHR